MIIFLFVVAYLIFAYHFLRNGIPWKVYGTQVSRLIWGFGFATSYMLLTLPNHNFITYGLFFILSAVAMLIPHAPYQNMGRWPNPQKTWTAFFLPTKTQAEWDAMTPAAKTRYDFYGMLSVGVVRAAIVYGVTTAALFFMGGWTPWALPAALVVALSQPFAYLLGWYVPVSIWDTPAKSNGWGEIGVAVGWAVSLAVYVGFIILF